MDKEYMIAEIVKLLEKMPVEHVNRMLLKCRVCVSLIEERNAKKGKP